MNDIYEVQRMTEQEIADMLGWVGEGDRRVICGAMALCEKVKELRLRVETLERKLSPSPDNNTEVNDVAPGTEQIYCCPRCGKPGPHFVPPSCGEPGFFICKPSFDTNRAKRKNKCPECKLNNRQELPKQQNGDA